MNNQPISECNSTRIGTKTINGRTYTLDLLRSEHSEPVFCRLGDGDSWQVFLVSGDRLITLYDLGDGPWACFEWYLDEAANGEVPYHVKRIAYELIRSAGIITAHNPTTHQF
jgi:hypothetical protein